MMLEKILIPLLLIIRQTRGDGGCEFSNLENYNISEACLKQMEVVCSNSSLAWKFFDASSRFLTPGMSYSNVMDLGNFPECLSIDHTHPDGMRIYGKYCGFSHLIPNVLLPDIKNSKQLRDILLGGTYPISKYSSCVPDACTPKEIGYFYGYANTGLFIFTDLPCETKFSNTDYEAGDIAVIFLFCLVAFLLLLSSIYDAIYCRNFNKKPHHPLLLSFSVLANGQKLLEISTNTTEQIQCFNGMRFISMMWVVAYHAVTVFDAGVMPMENVPEARRWSNSISNRYILSGLLAVDTFFFISGFLLAFSYMKTAGRENVVERLKKVPLMYLHRYLRLTPAVAMMYLVMITVFRLCGSGPLWTTITGLLKQTCKDKWWEFFLYVQNYTDPDGMCVNPTWYLSADMQMFILAPLVLIPVALYAHKHFKAVLWCLVAVTGLCIVIPMLVRYFGDQAVGNIYTTHERFNNFLIGITFGTVMRFHKHKKFIFSQTVNFFLWLAILLIAFAFNLYWFDVLANYELLKYTLFNGFYRPVWCLSLAFMVYSCYHNQGGIVQWILTRPAFQILGRLSYSMYIVHFMVEVYAGATYKTLSYFSNYFLFYNWCGHIIVTLILAVVWILAFEFPMLTIDRYILGDGRKKKTSDKQ